MMTAACNDVCIDCKEFSLPLVYLKTEGLVKNGILFTQGEEEPTAFIIAEDLAFFFFSRFPTSS